VFVITTIYSSGGACVGVSRQRRPELFVRAAPSRGTTHWIIKQFEEKNVSDKLLKGRKKFRFSFPRSSVASRTPHRKCFSATNKFSKRAERPVRVSRSCLK
jgi:hypothetical protein